LDDPKCYVRSYLGREIQVELSDGRILVGNFLAIDAFGRLCLKDVKEDINLNIPPPEPRKGPVSNERLVAREKVLIPINLIANMEIYVSKDPPPSPPARKK
jgi:small nuclear ribonucleoprotein (snRNP)-like protein